MLKSKSLITALFMITFAWSSQAKLSHTQKEYISGGTVKRSHLRAFFQARRVLEKEIEKELEFLCKRKEIKKDKAKKKYKKENRFTGSKKLKDFHALLTFLKKDCFDKQPLTKKISKLKPNDGFLSLLDRGQLYPHHGGLYRLEQEIQRKASIYHRLQSKVVCSDPKVKRALALVLENLRFIDEHDFKNALRLCMQKGYSKFGCKAVLDGFKIIRKDRCLAAEKQLHDKDASTKSSTPVLLYLFQVRRCLEDIGLVAGSFVAATGAI